LTRPSMCMDIGNLKQSVDARNKSGHDARREI
jgi:hypothetical protein